MYSQLSKFVCPKCKAVVEVLPGGPVACHYCGVFMEEVRKGITIKGIGDDNANKDKTKGSLGNRAE